MKDLNNVSEQLLLSVKQQQPSEALQAELKNISMAELREQLNTDDFKKAFWINTYNAYFLILRKYREVSKQDIYTKKCIEIAGEQWSLDDIEHGILRKGRYKYSLGFFTNPFLSKNIKKLTVSKLDYRIHFALNCGAKSCPPIAFYSGDEIDRQLEIATLSFLENETQVNESAKVIHISRLFLWYLGDFGSKRGIRKILKDKFDLNSKGFKIVFSSYSWEEKLDNFV